MARSLAVIFIQIALAYAILVRDTRFKLVICSVNIATDRVIVVVTAVGEYWKKSDGDSATNHDSIRFYAVGRPKLCSFRKSRR